MHHQILQQSQGLRGQLHGLPADSRGLGQPVQFQPTAGYPGCVGEGLSHLAAPQHRSDAGHQLSRVEGLVEIVVGSLLQGIGAGTGLADPGQQDHGCPVAASAQPGQHLPSVGARHQNVQDDQIGMPCADQLKRLDAVGGGEGDEPRPLQGAGEVVADHGVVVDDQDSCHAMVLPVPLSSFFLAP